MTIYQVVENFQSIDYDSYDEGLYNGKDVRVLKLCSSLEIAERFLSTLKDNYLMTIKENNLYYNPECPEDGPEMFPEVNINRFTIEAIEIE